jgi:hypothetical protein
MKGARVPTAPAERRLPAVAVADAPGALYGPTCNGSNIGWHGCGTAATINP